MQPLRGWRQNCGWVLLPFPWVAPIPNSLEFRLDKILQEPAFAASTLLSAAAVGLAIANYHKTLEYIGVVGLQLTIIRKLASYNSPTEFFEDVRIPAHHVDPPFPSPLQSKSFLAGLSLTNNLRNQHSIGWRDRGPAAGSV